MNQSETNPEIVPIAALRLDETPNRSQRNQMADLGTLDMPEGRVRLYANRINGSLIAIMPDRTGYTVSTVLFGNQCYKYWMLMTGRSVVQHSHSATADDEEVDCVPVPPITLNE